MILEFPSNPSTETVLLDARIRGLVAAPPLKLESGDWAFPLATVAHMVFAEVRIDARIIDPHAIVDGSEVWVDGVFEITRESNLVVDEDVAPVLIAVTAMQIEPVGLGPHLLHG